MMKLIGGSIGVFIGYIMLVVAFAYTGALAGIIVGLATSNTLFAGVDLTTVFAWIGVFLAHITFLYSVGDMIREQQQAEAIKAFNEAMNDRDTYEEGD